MDQLEGDIKSQASYRKFKEHIDFVSDVNVDLMCG